MDTIRRFSGSFIRCPRGILCGDRIRIGDVEMVFER